MTSPADAAPTTTAEAAAELGLTRLRPGQREAIEAAAAGRDVLAVLPTGWGKSAIYQVAALLVPGPTVVISPLLALQRDQVAGLDATTEAGAVTVSSAVSEAQRRRALDNLRRVEMVRASVEARTCRRAFLLGYLSEVIETPCNRCDTCLRLAAPGEPSELGELGEQVVVEAPVQDELAPGVRVRHGTFGEGELLGVEDDVLTVIFDDVGYKQLDRGLVTEANLVEVTSPAP